MGSFFFFHFFIITRPRPKAGGRVLNPARFCICIFSRCRKSALLRRWLVASRQSWEADWFARAVFWSRALAIRSLQLEKHESIVSAFQVGLFHLTLTQIKSEMNCIAKNKCPDSQKLETRRRGENFVQRVSRAATCIFLHSFSLIYFMWCKKRFRKSYIHSVKHSLIVSNVCVIIGTRPFAVIRLDKLQ